MENFLDIRYWSAGAGAALGEYLGSFDSLMYALLAFIVTDVNNRSYLIGQREQPWPFIESNQGMGMPDGESSTTVYTISHKGPRAMIPCSCAW